MNGLLPLICALGIAQMAMVQPVQPVATVRFDLWIAVGFALWLAAGQSIAQALRRTASASWLDRWELVAEILSLLWLAWLCLGLGWGAGSQLIVPILAPWILWQLSTWWILAPVVNRICGTTYTRSGYLFHHLRFALLPAALILPAADLVAYLGNHLILPGGGSVGGWFLGRLGEAGNMLASVLVGLAALILGPWVLVRLWGTRPLSPGPLRERLLAACREAGVGVADVRTWRGLGGREYNAMVLGILPAWRYVLFSDDLLAALPPVQLRAVLGHELGHARRRHLLVYLLYLATAGMAAMLAQGPLIAGLGHLPAAIRPSPSLAMAVVTVASMGLAWRLGFGALSRWCERQADLDGASFTSPIAMRDALLAVARLSGTDPRQASWHHGSMAERSEVLVRVDQEPGLARSHHRWMGRIALGLAAAAALLAVGLAWATSPGTLPPVPAPRTGASRPPPCGPPPIVPTSPLRNGPRATCHAPSPDPRPRLLVGDPAARLDARS